MSATSWQDDRDEESARSAAESGELPSYRHDEPADVSTPTDEDAHGAVIPERPRPAMLPMALTLLLGLLLGFAVGYSVGGRDSTADGQTARRRQPLRPRRRRRHSH